MKVMRKKITLYLLYLCLVASLHATGDLTQYVNPLYGTQWGGNVFIGTTRPNAIVKIGPDCTNHPNSGYDINCQRIKGFSHTHVSGTGGAPKYGNILMQPYSGNLTLNDYSSSFSGLNSSVGKFETHLDRYNIDVRLCSTERAAIHEYIFNQADSLGILIDCGHFLCPETENEENQILVGSEVKILSDREITGYSRVRNGWNRGNAYTVYFYAVSDTPASDFGVWECNNKYPGLNVITDSGNPVGCWLEFDSNGSFRQSVKIKVGISYISQEKAKQNLNNQLNHWNLDRVEFETKKEWNKILNTVKIETDTPDYMTMFYTALYHNYLMPVDKTGENPKWQSTEPYFDDFYTVWDTYRTTHPLLTILTPAFQSRIIRSLIDIYEHQNYMPDGRSGDDNGRTQGGSNCDILIADAYIKGLRGINYNKALEAMIKNAEIPPGNDERKEGRGGISDYNNLGYVSVNFERSLTRTFEYAACDFAIATVANGLNKHDLYKKYLKRSGNWKNLWHDGLESYGAKGFASARHSNGEWLKDFNPGQAGSWTGHVYESHSWEMSLYVPHDIPGLISKCGNKELFEARLDTFFHKSKPSNISWINTFFNVNNEPGFLTPCLYHWIGKPQKSSQVAREIIKKHFRAGTNALPGNDDSGALSAFLAFHLMGFYPVAGQDLYIIMAPHLKSVQIQLENGNTFSIICKNLGPKRQYIQSIMLNGKPFKQSWFHHKDIVAGGKFIFEMGPKPVDWTENALPPPALDLIQASAK